MPEVDKTDNAIQPVFVPFVKFDEEERMVWGYASTPTKDMKGEIVTLDCIKAALPGFMEWDGPVREMHQLSAAGFTKSAMVDDKGVYLGCKIDDDQAWRKCKPDKDGKSTYKGFSIGGAWKTKEGNVITGLQWIETSLVDRPMNPDCRIDVAKVAASQIPEGHKKPDDLPLLAAVDEPIPETEAKGLRERIIEKLFGPSVSPAVAIADAQVALAAKVEEKPVVAATTVKKGMGAVVDLAQLYSQLMWVKRALLDESIWEKDPVDAAMSDKVTEIMAMVGDLIQEKTQHEMEELKEGEDAPGAMVSMAAEATTVQKGVRSAAHKQSIQKAASYVDKAMAKHSAMGEQIAKCAGSFGKAADAEDVMGKLKDAHEALGEHLDMAKHHIEKAASDVSGSEHSLSDAEMEKAARVEAQKKTDDAERAKLEVEAKPVEKAVVVAPEDEEFDFTGLKPAQIKLLVQAREDRAVAKAVEAVNKKTPAGSPRAHLSQPMRGAPSIVTDAEGNPIEDANLLQLAAVAENLDPNDPNSIQVVQKAAGKAIGAMLDIPGVQKTGKGRSVLTDPTFKGAGVSASV